MPSTSFNLEAYFKRIGLAGTLSPTLETVGQLCVAHTEAIAFENLSSFLGESVNIDPASLQDKLIRGGRGGYCYEQNSLFQRALQELGFQATGLAARVRWNQPSDVMPPRSHMLLLVNLDDVRYIVDVGFGGTTPTAPIRIEYHLEQATPHETFRLTPSVYGFTLEVQLAGDWKPLYSFDLQEQCLADYEVLNWYHSTCPRSQFLNNLMVARPAPGCRHVLSNNKYSVHYSNGKKESRLLPDVQELLATLRTTFRLRLPDELDSNDKLARLFEPASANVPVKIDAG